MAAELYGVAAVLGLLALAAAWARKGRTGARGLEVVETAALGAGRTIAVVRAGRRRLLVGVTGQSIAMLAELDPAATDTADLEEQ